MNEMPKEDVEYFVDSMSAHNFMSIGDITINISAEFICHILDSIQTTDIIMERIYMTETATLQQRQMAKDAMNRGVDVYNKIIEDIAANKAKREDFC